MIDKIYELYNFADGNDDILSDIGNTGEVRHGMWAQIPYSVKDGDNTINEEFIHFVSNRDYYPQRPIPAMPIMVEAFYECVNNIKEYIQRAENKERFYNNLLKLQEYLISQGAYDEETLGLEKLNINEDTIINEAYTRKTADEIAKKLSINRGWNEPRYLGKGHWGFAYDIGNGLVLKITSDKTEVYENKKLINKPLKYIAKPYNVYQINLDNKNIGNVVYAVVLEKFKTNKSFFNRKIERLDYIFKKIFDYGLENVVLSYINGGSKYVDSNKINKYFIKNPEDFEFFNSLLKIGKELKQYGIESTEFLKPANLGFTKSGDIGTFDVGFTEQEFDSSAEEININEFGGDSLYVTNDNMGGGDNFSTHDNIDTSPSIQNDLNANRVNIEERNVSFMPKSSAVSVKKKCRLGGLGNTSVACNQGDIKNLDIKSLHENVEKFNLIHIDNETFYHQTNEYAAESIIKNGFHVFSGVQARFTEGIYFLNHPEGRYGDVTLECIISGNFIDLVNDNSFSDMWLKLRDGYKWNNYSELTEKIQNDYPNADGIIFGNKYMLVVWYPEKCVKSIKIYENDKDDLNETIALDGSIDDFNGWKSFKIMNDGEIVGEIELSKYRNNEKYIKLDKIFINKEHRKMGHAQDAMEVLIKYADDNKKIIVLTPDNVWGANKEKLKKWYKSFGFVMNSGRYADFATTELMYRLPKSVKFETGRYKTNVPQPSSDDLPPQIQGFRGDIYENSLENDDNSEKSKIFAEKFSNVNTIENNISEARFLMKKF